MYKNYFKSLYRTILFNKFYTLFNVIGLSTGFVSAIFILLYVQDELSYDRHYKSHERIYRLESAFTVNNDVNRYATFPVPLGPTLKSEIPDIEQMTRIHPAGELLVRYRDKEFYEWGFVFADSTIFDVFSHEFISGNPGLALTQSNSIVLTESVAAKYFGDEEPIGKMVTDGANNSYRVTGIIQDLPSNTHLKYNGLISMTTKPDVYNITKASRYWRVVLYTYILLNEESSIDAVHSKFLDYYVREMEPLGKQFNVSFELLSTPLKNTHFTVGLLSERPTGKKAYLVIFSVIAGFILLIAAINYMNMATARSANRAKEVGVRKVLGADRAHLVRQFLGESFVLSLLALILSLLIVWLVIPSFNDFTGKEITFGIFKNAVIFTQIVGIAILIGLFSGSYPAFFLSAFKPTSVLKGQMSRSGKGSRILRKILVSLQFFIAVFMIIASLVVSGQMNFLREKDLGYEPENIIVIQIGEDRIREQMRAFINEIIQNPNIINATNSHGIPGITPWLRTMRIESNEGMRDEPLLYLETDFDFADTYGLNIMQGRNFSRDMGTDSLEAVLINETTAYKFGWLSDPLGKRIHFGFNQEGKGGRMLKVIGVVDDFNFWSLHNTIEPLILFIQNKPGNLLSIKISDQNRDAALLFLEEKWRDFGADYPFRYEYLTERNSQMYSAENKTGQIISIGTIITIILALLGLMGLSSFVAEQKTREIGIRKVHGASVQQILLLLYKDFIYLFLFAFIIAAPVAWWRLSIWLETEFAYFKEISWMTFLIAGILAILMGMVTISLFIIRAAYTDPVKTIKYE